MAKCKAFFNVEMVDIISRFTMNNPTNTWVSRKGYKDFEEMQEQIKQFHLRGGIDYSRLGLTHKAMMAMLRSVMLRKGYDTLRPEDKMMLDTYGGCVDFTDRASLTPLLSYVRSLL